VSLRAGLDTEVQRLSRFLKITNITTPSFEVMSDNLQVGLVEINYKRILSIEVDITFGHSLSYKSRYFPSKCMIANTVLTFTMTQYINTSHKSQR
jgi:hypothetical protein